MTLRLSVAAIGLLLSGSVFSAVTITAPEEIVILAVNGQEVNSGLFRSSKNNYKVDAGETNLSVRYQEYFEHLNGEHDIVKSGVVTIQTPTLKDGQTYKLAMVGVPKNMSKQRNMLSNQQSLYITQITNWLFSKLVQTTKQNLGLQRVCWVRWLTLRQSLLNHSLNLFMLLLSHLLLKLQHLLPQQYLRQVLHKQMISV